VPPVTARRPRSLALSGHRSGLPGRRRRQHVSARASRPFRWPRPVGAPRERPDPDSWGTGSHGQTAYTSITPRRMDAGGTFRAIVR
jgi:hypothetical protein